jgi:hypothetical protein
MVDITISGRLSEWDVDPGRYFFLYLSENLL